MEGWLEKLTSGRVGDLEGRITVGRAGGANEGVSGKVHSGGGFLNAKKRLTKNGNYGRDESWS